MERITPKDVTHFYDQALTTHPDTGKRSYSFSQLLIYALKNFGDVLWADLKTKGGEWKKWTYPDVVALAIEVAEHLEERGLKPGDRVAILSESCPEFVAHFFAIGMTGGCMVPVDPKLSRAEMEKVLSHSEAKFLFHSKNLSSEASTLGALVPAEEFLKQVEFTGPPPFLIQELKTHWEKPRNVDAPLILLYTSGTSGEPKGVLLSTDNVLFDVQDLLRGFPPEPQPTHYLSILPMNHVFELICGALRPFVAGARITYVENIQSPEMLQILKSHGIKTVLCVPAFLTLIRKRLEREIDRNPKAVKLWNLLGAAQRAGLPVKWRLWLATPIRKQFAQNLTRFAIGGAGADLETIRFFDRMGILALQGYGLSETSAGSTLSSDSLRRPGASGKPLPGVELKIDQPNEKGEGEILIRGRSIMLGYYKRPDLTNEVMTKDGWFKSGDLGYLDDDGFLWVKGRVRNLIVLPSGKKVVPEEVEAWLLLQPEVAEACVILFGGKVTAVITPAEAWWRGTLGKSAIDDEVCTLLETCLRERDSKALAEFKVPNTYWVERAPLPKTTTLKVKRADVLSLLERGKK